MSWYAPESIDLSGMDGVFDETAFIYDVAMGNVAKELETTKKELLKQKRELNKQYADLQKLPMDAAKAEAMSKFQRAETSHTNAMTNLQKAIDDHNEVADVIRKVTVGAVSPPKVTLSAFPLLPVALIVAGVAALGISLFGLASVITAVKGEVGKTRGFIADSADAIAGVFKEAGTAAGGTMTSTAWAVVAVVGSVLAFQMISDWRKRRNRFSDRPAFAGPTVKPTATGGLKTVKGEVLA